MQTFRPNSSLSTHEVTNMPPYLGDQDLWRNDIALQEGVSREAPGIATEQLTKLGQLAGKEDTFYKAAVANRFSPELKAFDRHGMRINQVEYHPAYHDLMQMAIENQVSNFAWRHRQQSGTNAGAHVVHAALNYMMGQPEGGVTCPMAMAYAAVPSLKMSEQIASEWIPRLLTTEYDPRDRPITEKKAATLGMFMTEKQGGSDIRSNSTRAEAIGASSGEGAEYELTGHKFFCSAPMSDAFLTLAYTPQGLSCFLMPRWKPDGERNTLMIQRLKDKLGNRGNASCEIELDRCWAVMLGQPGQGIKTIIEMVQANRFWCCSSSTALMRQGLVQAYHHTRHRQAFQKRLVDQPLMQNVLCDLQLEVEASLMLTLRLGRAIDEADTSDTSAALARIGTAISKYWICKRTPGHVVEALECLGGSGYIEDSMMPRLYRDAPLNNIWEGSGNIMCLDVLRAIEKEPATLPAILTELDAAKGGHRQLDSAVSRLRQLFKSGPPEALNARAMTELLAVSLQAALLIRYAPNAISDAFCSARLAQHQSMSYGCLPSDTNFKQILNRILVS